ncbi:MAG: sigma-70 family RNA polymerase sigma factor [Ilumatobacter sp.]|uniref:RNA polymerase sigma factor n=1 Tax=Ilumatobacter sp. TaxID=1967498 RepID=UPI00262CF9BA|nr:sigma-70 family RNA polymerase sigma factor [Ilumatobacter sp.]MDJ0767949.1 sigma-70 family RNA polymerase sigma factor [Ilumatobacter sp.]
MSLDPDELGAIYRREVGRCTATLVRALGDVDRAEDAVADAFAIAAERWAADGVPPNPGGWITTTARNRAIDRIRREASRTTRERAALDLYGDDRGTGVGIPDLGSFDAVPDDQLRLIFLCCHPALRPEAQVALTLRLLGGLTTSEIARAFLVPEPTMGQRLSRAKRKIRDTHMAYRLPDEDELPRRLGPVLATIYLIYTEGHAATAGDDLMRPALTGEAIRITETLVELLPDEPEAAGLLALMLLTEARAPARVDVAGNLVPLPDQDRSSWDRASIAEGHRLVRACLDRDEPGPYQLQAAIAAVHADAPTAGETDWAQIVALYDHLLVFRPNDVVRLNRAIAVMEHDDASAALAALERIDLPLYHLFHATRAEALRRVERRDEAAEALGRAIALASNATERRHLERRLAELV